MKNGIFTSESVTEGHPDKLCDQISDAVLDAMLEQDPNSRVACETVVNSNTVKIVGEVTTKANVDIESIARKVIRDIGYTHEDLGISSETCRIDIELDNQSQDIADGVDEALEVRAGETWKSDIEDLGAGDQGMMFGYACRDTDELMPLPITLSHKLAKKLAEVRKEGLIEYLRPDGKSQVTVKYIDGKPVYVDTIIISAQHDPDSTRDQLEQDIKREVIFKVIPKELICEKTKIYINPSGRFVIGGPKGDSGLTGRKIIVDTYGGMGRHGGGAFSGKDATKVDRSASYAARWIAKNVVAADLADRVEVQLAYAIGKARPVSIYIDTFGTNKVCEDDILIAIDKSFDLRPAAIIRDLKLREPIYQQIASYGHMGRTDIDIPWEQVNRVDKLLGNIQ